MLLLLRVTVSARPSLHYSCHRLPYRIPDVRKPVFSGAHSSQRPVNMAVVDS